MPMSRSWSVAVTHVILSVVVCGGPPAWAQELSTPTARSVLATAEEQLRALAETRAARPPTAATQPAPPQREAAAAIPRPRLSGSTTGYVENAFIGSQVRVRFDAGFGIATPDRAEFFYGKCGCYRLAGIDPDAPGPVGVLPPGGDPAVTPLIENDLDYRDVQFYGEFALHQRFSLFVDAPIRSISPSIVPEATGFGDMRAGAKLGLIASDTRALTFQFRSYFPTGDAGEGLGTAHPSIEFTLLYDDIVAERVTIGTEFGVLYPIDGSSGIPASVDSDWSGDVLRWGVGVGVDLVSQPQFRFAPVVEFVGWHLLGGYATVTPDGTPANVSFPSVEGLDIVNLKLGGRFTFNGRHSLYAGYGLPLTDAHWYDDIIRVEYRLAF